MEYVLRYLGFLAIQEFVLWTVFDEPITRAFGHIVLLLGHVIGLAMAAGLTNDSEVLA